MPLQTFYNLEEQRQKEIIEVACREFALNNYHTASISNIVKDLGIAKGSFYRYFESKIDLYSYIIDYSFKIRIEQVSKLIVKNPFDFFEVLKENFKDKIRFDIEYPLLSGLTYQAFLESQNEEIKPIIGELINKVVLMIKQLLLQYQQSGAIRKDLNIEQAAFLIFQVQLGVYDYLHYYKGIDFKRNIQMNEPIFSLPEGEIMEIVNGFVNLLKCGLE